MTQWHYCTILIRFYVKIWKKLLAHTVRVNEKKNKINVHNHIYANAIHSRTYNILAKLAECSDQRPHFPARRVSVECDSNSGLNKSTTRNIPSVAACLTHLRTRKSEVWCRWLLTFSVRTVFLYKNF